MIQTKAIDQAEFGVALGNLRKAVDAGLVDPSFGTISTQARLLTEHCMKLTPPRTVGQGKRRIQADVALLFNPIEPDSLRDKGLKRLARTGTMDDWNHMATGAKRGRFSGKMAVEPSVPLHEPHKLNLMRGHRGGGRKNLPNWVTLWKQRGALRSAIKSVQERVGWAKAGWLKALLALGGSAGDWISRHGTSRGEFIDARNSPTRPYVEVRNLTKWARFGESERVVETALRGRNRAMQKYFDTMMSLAARGIATPYQETIAKMRSQPQGD